MLDLVKEERSQVTLEYTQIRTDGGTQMRAGLNEETVEEYAAAMLEAGGWGTFPPAVVYHDGANYWLGDGFHRVAAFTKAKVEAWANQERGNFSEELPVIVHAGDRRAAILHAAAANSDHGLRRTNADKRRAVETLLRDEEWSQWSDREIARRCRVSHQFVSNIRPSLSTVDSENGTSTERTYTTKHGTAATMNVDGQRQAANERAQRNLNTRASRLIKNGWGFTHYPRPPHGDGKIAVEMPARMGSLGTFDDEEAAIAAAEEAQRSRARPMELPPDLGATCHLVSDGIHFYAQVYGRGKGPRRERFDAIMPAIAWLREQEAQVDMAQEPDRGAQVIAMVDDDGEVTFRVDDDDDDDPPAGVAVYDYGNGDDEPTPDELPADLVALGCKLDTADGWYFVQLGRHADTCGSLDQAIRVCRKWTGTAEPAAGQPCQEHQQRVERIRVELEFWAGAQKRVERIGELTGRWNGPASALGRAIGEVIGLLQENVSE